ncbi:MAG: copper resistance protein CopC/CopD [Actinomycetota bacterium]|nr:copper resistance protein CopC/CopD [Actinomycetota bacterium]
MKARRFLIVLALTSMIVGFQPSVASGHAGFVSSTPDPGASLGSAPGVVTLGFSEPLNVQLSEVEVTAPDGHVWPGSTTEDGMTVPISTNELGVYEVSWRTVSLVDGHPLTGTFRFGVGVRIGADAAGETRTSPRVVDLMVAAARTVEDVALFLAAGLLLLTRLAPSLSWVRRNPRPSLTIALLSGMLVVLGEAVAAAASPTVASIVAYLTTGLPGTARLARPALELAALLLAIFRPRWCVGALGAVFVAMALAGHAAATDPKWWGVLVETVHLTATAIWAGGIMALAFQRPPDGWRGEEGRALLDRFTPVALLAFAVSITTGAIRGTQEVGSLSALVTSAYGLALLLKIFLIALMVQLSILAWRRILVRPRWESAVVVGVVGAATLLAAFPIPPSRLAEAVRAEEKPVEVSALPRPGDLTLGGQAGAFLIGLTIRSDPGRLLIFVQGVEGDPDTATRAVGIAVNDVPLTVTECAPTCRQADRSVRQGDEVSVTVDGTNGGTARFRVPDPSSPSADDLLARMRQRMQTLSTYRMDEELRSGLAAIHTRYAFQAPDRLATVGETDGSTSRLVWIGSTRYLRDLGTSSWRTETNAATPTVPAFLWDSFQPVIDVRRIGSAEIGGVRTEVVVFFAGEADLPVWFRLWIDHTGLVRQAQMRAQGHFMDQTYSAFDRGFEIRPPQGAA